MCMCAVCDVRRKEGVPPAAQGRPLVFCVSRVQLAKSVCRAAPASAASPISLPRLSHSVMLVVVLRPLFSSRVQGASAYDARLRPLLRWADARLLSQPGRPEEIGNRRVALQRTAHADGDSRSAGSAISALRMACVLAHAGVRCAVHCAGCGGGQEARPSPQGVTAEGAVSPRSPGNVMG